MTLGTHEALLRTSTLYRDLVGHWDDRGPRDGDAPARWNGNGHVAVPVAGR